MSDLDGYRPPSEMAGRIRDLMRRVHGGCDRAGCPLSFITAEDIDEIFAALARLTAERERPAPGCTCTGWMSERGPDEPDPNCPVHGGGPSV